MKKGEKGLTIIAPTPLKKKIEEMRLDPDTKAPVLDGDGNIIMDEKTVEIPLFKPVKVFTADQTEGKPLPSLATGLTGDVQQYEAFMEALRRTSPMPISFVSLAPDTDGVCSFTKQTISIREGMSQVQTVCATVHKIGHAVLHDREKDRLSTAAGNTDKDPPKAKDKNTMEVEAESVSFAVCQYYGIDTSANSIDERNLVCIYSGGGTRLGTIAALEDMRRYLEPDEAELRELTDSALDKLRGMDDAAFAALDLIPDFDPEDAAYGE